MIRLNKFQKVAALGYVVVLGLWITIHLTGRVDENADKLNYWYSFLFGLIPLFGGLIGMFGSRIWGSLRSVLGKAVFFFSLGLFLWGFGETIWSYYNFFRSDPAPYPSLADIGFASSIVFWIVGAFFLAKASGAMYALKKSKAARITAVVVPLVLSAVAYYMLVKVARGGVIVPAGESLLKVILDILYPLGDFLALTLALLVFLLSRKYLGGIYRLSIAAILFGLGMMYFGDFSFSYTTTTGTFYNGNPGDLLLATGTFLMSFGILGFVTRPQTKSSATVSQGDE